MQLAQDNWLIQIVLIVTFPVIFESCILVIVKVEIICLNKWSYGFPRLNKQISTIHDNTYAMFTFGVYIKPF